MKMYSFSNFNLETLKESSKFTKIMHYIHGNKRIGAGFAIMTAYNPMGEESSDIENYRSQEELKKILKGMGKSYFVQHGKYGSEEESLVILNVTDEEAKKLAFDSRWKQDSYIHASPNKNGIIFKLERHNGKKITTEIPKSDVTTNALGDYFSYVQSVMKDKSGNKTVEKRKYVLGFNFPDTFWDDEKIPGKGETPPQQPNKELLAVKWIRQDENKWIMELRTDTYAQFTKFKDIIKLHLIHNNHTAQWGGRREFPNNGVGEYTARSEGRRFIKAIIDKESTK